jgi:hypothetical protein
MSNEPEQTDGFKKIFDVIKRKEFLEHFTNIKPSGGFNHRYSGKGTNQSDQKNKILTDDDKREIRLGVKKLIPYLQEWLKENK